MKRHVLLALAALTMGCTVPALAQEKDTVVDPQIVQQLHAIGKKSDEAFLKGDVAARVALFTEDAVYLGPSGPIYGREAIEKYYADLFQKVHFLSNVTTYDPTSPHPIGTDGNAVCENGEFSATVIIQGQDSGPKQIKGYWASVKVREGDTWKIRLTTNTPAAAGAATPSPTATPNNP
jgi:uncharacterized protein (TIGR02246 family)